MATGEVVQLPRLATGLHGLEWQKLWPWRTHGRAVQHGVSDVIIMESAKNLSRKCSKLAQLLLVALSLVSSNATGTLFRRARRVRILSRYSGHLVMDGVALSLQLGDGVLDISDGARMRGCSRPGSHRRGQWAGHSPPMGAQHLSCCGLFFYG
jgi:hypothetical protein